MGAIFSTLAIFAIQIKAKLIGIRQISITVSYVNAMTYHGWILVDKPLGITSTDAVRKIKKLLKVSKIGHAGTLDPLASGMLIIALGEATKAIDFAMLSNKTYEFTITWGESRDTIDAEGKVIKTSDVRPSLDQIKQAIAEFMPSYLQTPPKYSAVKINGQRAYDLARKGIDFEIQPKLVELSKVEITSHDDYQTSFTIDCGKGFYVRSLAHDIAEVAGACGYVSHLRRTRCGKFDQADMISLESLEKLVYKDGYYNWNEIIQPIIGILDDILVCQVSREESIRLKFGQRVRIQSINQDRTVVAVFDNTPIAICVLADNLLIPKRIFNL